MLFAQLSAVFISDYEYEDPCLPLLAFCNDFVSASQVGVYRLISEE